MDSGWGCYCLVSKIGTTYVGASTNVERRLRQHNREIQGGARATGRSEGWRRVCHILGFPEERSALQFEWAWKHISRKAEGATPLERRCKALIRLLNQEKATSKAKLFSEFEGPLVVFIEDDQMIPWLEGTELRYGILTFPTESIA